MMRRYFRCFALCLLLGAASSLDNGQAKTPPMGFNPWNIWGKMNGGKPRYGLIFIFCL